MNTLEQAKALLKTIDAGHHDHDKLAQAVEVLRKTVDWVESQEALYAAPAPAPAAVPELASMLDAVRGVIMDAHNRAFPVCCGRGQRGECCGSPDPDWSKEDQAIMTALAPVERALMKMLAAAQGGNNA